MSSDSCLVTRLERYLKLTSAERNFIVRMEEDERRKRSGSIIYDIGDPVERMFVLKFGWAIVRSAPHRGRSHIVRVYLPGEVIGIAELSSGEAMQTLCMQTDGAVCPFPRSAMADMYLEAPRLAALLTAVSSLDQMALRERMVSLARRDARGRMIEFMLSLRDRLAVANVGMGHKIHVPFSQPEIGDILGLTPVYVNKLLRLLSDEGKIKVERPYVRILEPDALAREIKYANIHERLDTTWFPEPT